MSAFSFPFVQAAQYTKAHRERIDQVVIHTTETACLPGVALILAKRFALTDKKKSAHYIVDPGETVQCVHERDVAWHCKRVNRRGIGIELCARSKAKGKRKATDWESDNAVIMLRRAAYIVSSICHRWGIPVRHLSRQELLDGEKGIIGHVDASEAFKTPGGHRDPGPAFPWETFLEMVAEDLVLWKQSERA